MGEREVIRLKKPLLSPEGPVSQVVLREPTFDEYLVHGDPYTIAAFRGGSPFMVENADVIAQYIKLCLVEPKDPAILSQGKARLAREVKERLLSFFQPDAPEPPRPSGRTGLRRRREQQLYRAPEADAVGIAVLAWPGGWLGGEGAGAVPVRQFWIGGVRVVFTIRQLILAIAFPNGVPRSGK